MKPFARPRQTAHRGSWRWTVHVAEITAWGTVVLILVVLQLAGLDSTTYARTLIVTAALALWLWLFFHVLLFRSGAETWTTWAGVVVDVLFATALFALLRDHVPSAQLIFVPVVIATGLLGGFNEALAASLLAVAGFWGVAAITGPAPSAIAGVFNTCLLLLTGSVAGLLARELRTHYRAEQEEHRLATAVRLRLLAVLDAVDEAIVFRDRQGMARVVNERAGELFGVDPDSFIGLPAVGLLRTIARQTEDPEGFMETFQQLRDDPEKELRFEIDQIMPIRRQLRLFSGPTLDDDGDLVGRIDVYTDITEGVRRAAEVQQLYEEARKTAESYQRALLPEAVPSLPRLSLVAHYIAAAGRRAVCGDFYDFIPFPDGRFGIVLGDVCGIGPRAANDAALSRYTMRSLTARETDPGRLMVSMNEQVRLQCDAERFVRLMFGVLDPERAHFEYANAGHVPPIVYRQSNGDLEWLEEGGLALGIEEDVDFKVGHIELEPGDMLILYTDGLTEAPRHGRPFGRGKFGDIVQEYGVGTPGELVQALRRSVDAWTSEGGLRDDLALVVCQVVPDRALGEPTRELVLPNEPIRVAEVRAFVADFLADLRAPVETSAEILLAVGEAAANAYRHGRKEEGRNEIRVHCALEGPIVSVTVADDGPGFNPAAAEAASLPDRFSAGGRGLFLMRKLMDDVEIDISGRGTKVTMSRRVFDSSGNGRGRSAR
jgi:serine phosphatase RsbU (regulator of sigma subunit)/anti-sigma regulatory factor (Ser/Thr protein kinase)/PAS domain-containing protein